jgi:type I restriction enzyme R subunit
MMKKYGDEKQYNKTVKDHFRDREKPEILIVVHKLLTGFDAPRNTVMYVNRKLYDHTLLQAIARVNRIFPGKDYGYIIDYSGILYNLDKALTEYRALAEYDKKDLQGALTSVYDKIKELPQKHSDLWEIFKEIPNKLDTEAFERLLGDEAVRHRFYEKLSQYAKLLNIALSTLYFHKRTPPERIAKYRRDLKFFTSLRERVKLRYSESFDFKEYEVKFKKLIDTYVDADDVLKITPQVSIFDEEKFKEEVKRLTGSAAKADTIAHRTIKAVNEKYDEDPVYYEKFSKLLEETIENFRQQRLTEAEYLKQSRKIESAVRERKGDDLPGKLRDKPAAAAFFRISRKVLEPINQNPDSLGPLCTKISLAVEDIISIHRVVDWHLKEDIRNNMRNDIEDYLYDLKDNGEVDLSYENIDEIMDSVLDIAQKQCRP